MNAIGAYQKQSLLAGWTRIDLLLQIYERAITSIDACEIAFKENDESAYVRHFIQAQKAVLAIHAGLKPDEHEVAFNVARLLHFVLVCIEKRDFKAAAKVLRELRDGFAAVADEVNRLEREGMIPPVPGDDTFQL